MTFDLYAFPASGPKTVTEAHQLLEAEDAEGRLRFDSDTGEWLPRPGPQMAKFVEELERRWPSLEDDPDGSPWSSWPLRQPMAGGGTGLNIGWSHTGTVPAILEVAARHNVIIYDPQADQLIHTPPSRPGRRFFKHRG